MVIIQMYDETIILITRKDTTDDYGDTICDRSERTVYAEVMSIGQTEFYQAADKGLKPDIKFKLADYADYQGEKEVRYGDITYEVLRTYRTSRNELEITVHGGVKNGSTTVGC